MQSASLLTVLLLAQIAWAQSSPSPAQSAPATIHVDTQFVLLDALVENKKTGRTVDTLSRKIVSRKRSAISAAINCLFP
jgi:hypothetical protein